MTEEPYHTTISEPTNTAPSVGADAVAYIQAEALELKNKGTLYVQAKPRLAIFFAILVGFIIGRMAVR